MGILSISRDWGTNPSIVRITTDDNLSTITTTNYLVDQAENIEEINNGAFQWAPDDTVLIYYANGEGFFTRDAANETFDAFPSSPGSLSDTLQDGDIFVGNASNVATGVTPSGDITLTNAGVFGIASGVIVNADINASAAIAFSKLAALSPGEFIVGNGASVPTAFAMNGDATLNSSGAVTIQNSAITTAKINNSAVTTAKIADANVTSAKIDPAVVQYVEVDLTASQWNGMYAAPVQLVAAPGANKVIVVDAIALNMTFVAAQYAAGGAVAAQYDSTVHGAGSLATATVAAATVNGYAASTGIMLAGAMASVPFTAMVNKGLYLSNQTAAFTTGDSTWKVQVWYRVVATA